MLLFVGLLFRCGAMGDLSHYMPLPSPLSRAYWVGSSESSSIDLLKEATVASHIVQPPRYKFS
jgi:hypothetical protein